jgi:hypothetical protein
LHRNRTELIRQGVAKASHRPSSAHDPSVLGKVLLVPSPHSHRRMIPPPRLRVSAMLANVDAECDQDLLALDSLLAESLVIEAPGR